MGNSVAMFVSQYREDKKLVSQYGKDKVMECHIVLSDTLFNDTRDSKELRKAAVVHEFCHFLALIYGSVSISEEKFQIQLRERLSKKIDLLTNEDAQKILAFLQAKKQVTDFSVFEQIKDTHFRLTYEDLELSYADLFSHFLLSRQLIGEYFLKEDRKNFTNLVREGKTQDAYNLYIDIIKKIAEEKWLPENFAILHGENILKENFQKWLI